MSAQLFSLDTFQPFEGKEDADENRKKDVLTVVMRLSGTGLCERRASPLGRLTSCCGTGKEIVPCRKICYKNPCTCLHQPMTLWQGVCYAHSPGKSAPVPVVLAHRNPPRHSSPGQAAL